MTDILDRLDYASGFVDEPAMRASFNGLVKACFGLDLARWHAMGLWTERYEPHTLFDGDSAVSNVSVNHMRLRLDGREVSAVQLGTVCTHPAYRGMGLSSALMEIVLDQYRESEFMYLFANAKARDFYPRFGFLRSPQRYPAGSVPAAQAHGARKLSLSDSEEDRRLFLRLAGAARPRRRIAMEDNLPLILFYCAMAFQNDLYYIPDLDAAVVAQYDAEPVRVVDVFCEREAPLDAVIASMARCRSRFTLGFTPAEDEGLGFDFVAVDEADDILFIRPATDLPGFFPLLSRA